MTQRYFLFRVAFVGLLLVMVTILAGCTRSATADKLHGQATFEDASQIKCLIYEVGPLPTAHRLSVDFELNAGHMQWTVVDPTGATRWQGEAEAGKRVRKHQAFEPISGDWWLLLTLTDASGEYEVSWNDR